MSYDLDGDVAKARADKARRVASGDEKSDAEVRADGGIPLSPRAAVLLEHFSRSQTFAKYCPAEMREKAAADAITCTRRIIEYIGALEDVALQAFTTEPGDVPKESIGLAAASLEKLCDDIDQHAAASGAELDPSSSIGVETWRSIALRLRHIEFRINAVPGQSPDSPLILPDVRG